ncbi:MAG: RuBisCO accumulation factor 1 [Cyanobacteriota bacterium]|nr:RuBisCO accumulation factor 1 [Cyanobacteriota bacterium]
MTEDKPQDTTPSRSELSEAAAATFVRQLRHKEGNWVEWGKACHALHKAGYDPKNIFEETGFEAVVQNQVVVAAQVYESIAASEVDPKVLSFCAGPKSDVLYEFRILNQTQRAAAAELAAQKNLDVDGAHLVARAIKDFARLSMPPEGFSNSPGDVVAYVSWKQARQKKDLQERSRLIAQGLKFAQTRAAREQIERLLSDFTVEPTRKAPMLPTYRIDAEEQLPRIIPVVGSLPLTRAQIEAVPTLEEVEPFRVVSGNGAWVPLPGWQVILRARDPVAILTRSDRLLNFPVPQLEEVVVAIDRQVKTWDINSYFLVESEEGVEVGWFEEAPDRPILGQVILVLRPKRILDESNITSPWQMDD